jgi:hypothetical protein
MHLSRIGLIILFCFLLCAGSVAAQETFDHEYKLLKVVLEKHVANGRINYARLLLERSNLDEVVRTFEALKKKEYETFSQDQKRAFWINAYNLFVLRVVIDNYPIKSKEEFSNYPKNSPMNIEGAWNDKTFKSPLGKVTLNRVQNDLLPSMGQPYWIFAVCNGTKGAPDLAPEPYLASRLADQLDKAAERFVRNPEKVAFDQAGKTITISKYLQIHGQGLIAKLYAPDLYKRRDKLEIALLNLFIRHGDPALTPFVRGNLYNILWQTQDWSLNDVL